MNKLAISPFIILVVLILQSCGHHPKTPLEQAVDDDNYDHALYLIKNGADINELDGYGSTILHDAAILKHIDGVEFLLKNGADPNIENVKGSTALMYACFPLYEDNVDARTLTIVQLLIEHGANINAINKKKSVLDGCKLNNYVSVVLKAHGAKSAKELLDN